MTNPKQLCIADNKRQPIPWAELEKLALADNRTISEYARLVLINHVKNKGK